MEANHYGRIEMSGKFYRELKRNVKTQRMFETFVCQGVMILDVHQTLFNDMVELYAIWEGFDPVPEGVVIPRYQIIFKDNKFFKVKKYSSDIPK